MPVEWAPSIVVPIFKKKGDIRNHSSYRAVKILEHGMKVVERVFEKRIRRIVSVDEMQFGFMPESNNRCCVYLEKSHANGKKLYMCFVVLEKAFDRVPRKVFEWTMTKKGLLEALFRSVMSLYGGAKTRVRADSELSEEFEVKVWMHQGSVLSSFIFAVVVDVVTEFAKEGALRELLYANDLILMSETIEGLRNKFLKWKEAFESKGLKVNLGKTKVMVSGDITQEGLSKSKFGTCGVCSLRVKANSVLCVQCGKWIHGRCAEVKRVTPKFTCRKCERNIGEAVEQEEK